MIYTEGILVCIAVPVAAALFFVRGGMRRFAGFFLLGLAGSLVAAYISGFFALLLELSGDGPALYVSPIAEEAVKALPLIFYAAVFKPRDGRLISSAAAVGVGFAVFENCCYLLDVGGLGPTLLLVRGFCVGLMHVACAVCVAYALVAVRKSGSIVVSGVVGAVALAIVLHATYNLLVSEPGVPFAVGCCLPAVTVILFWLDFRRRGLDAGTDV